MQPETTHPFNRMTAQLMRAHDAIEYCLNARDYHSLRVWAEDAEKMELSLNSDVELLDSKGRIGYIFDGDRHQAIYEEDII